jgi:DNA-binding transcriptional ArsR family regulator
VAAFEPKPIHRVETPEQLKAFTDQLRVRILEELTKAPATKQQLATKLGEPQANVLYHLRSLLHSGLIQLVATQVKGGNVEKYYRAIAITFELRTPPQLAPDILGAQITLIEHDFMASARRWPSQPPYYVALPCQIAPERAAEFFERLRAFLAEAWCPPGQHTSSAATPDATSGSAETVAQQFPRFYCVALVYRSPDEAAE